MLINKNLKKIKNNFDNDGYVILNNFFKKKKIQSLRKNLFSYLSKKKLKLKKSEIHFVNDSSLINSVHHLKWPYINKFKKNKKIVKIVKSLLEENIKSFGAEVFAKPAKVGMAVPIHQDNYYWNVDNSKGVTVWIALNKSTEENGAIFYYKKSQKLGLLRHKASHTPGSSQVLKNMKILNKFKKVMLQLNVGDILIHHSLVLHGSKKNTSNKDRTGLTLRYIGKSSKINKVTKFKYEKELKKQLL